MDDVSLFPAKSHPQVHHKTEFGSNLTGHGFPDPGHLDNVLEELRAQGITEDDGLVEK